MSQLFTSGGQKSSIAHVINDVNAYCKENGKTAILIVPGRIGTSSPELGIPVVFADISYFSAILEESYSEVGYMPELSFGSHMFQDLVEAEIYYGALFENEKKLEFNKDMIYDHKNILKDINPNLSEEIYDMICQPGPAPPRPGPPRAPPTCRPRPGPPRPPAGRPT